MESDFGNQGVSAKEEQYEEKKTQGGHRLVPKVFTSPNVCAICEDFIWGLDSSGFECQDCALKLHSRCSAKIPADSCGSFTSTTRNNQPKVYIRKQAFGETSQDDDNMLRFDEELESKSDEENVPLPADSDEKDKIGRLLQLSKGNSMFLRYPSVIGLRRCRVNLRWETIDQVSIDPLRESHVPWIPRPSSPPIRGNDKWENPSWNMSSELWKVTRRCNFLPLTVTCQATSF